MNVSIRRRPRQCGRPTKRRRAIAALVLIFALPVDAQPVLHGAREPHPARRARPAVEDLLPLADFEDDPIGLDHEPVVPAVVAAPSPVARLDKRHGPQPPTFRSQRGEVLTGVAALRETAHRVHVRFADGLAHVRVELTLQSTSAKPAEVHYRLAVPRGSVEASLKVCSPAGCQDGVAVRATDPRRGAYDAAIRARAAAGLEGPPLPVAHFAPTPDTDGRGPALLLRAAPVTKGAPLQVTLEYTAPAPMRGGVSRLRLPARGMDGRVSQAQLSLDAPSMLDPQIDGHTADDVPVELDPWMAAELSARGRPGVSLTAHHFDCGQRRCVRLRASAGAGPARPRDVLIALDVSPSMEGPARSRMGAALLELLASLPAGTRVRALAFASRARVLIEDARLPAQVGLAIFARASTDASLGAATRFEAAWPILARWAADRRVPTMAPLVIVIGDGGLTTGASDPFAPARAAGVEVSVINLADRNSLDALRAGALATGGTLLEAGAAARRAARGHGGARLREQLAALFAPTAARRLHARGALGGRITLAPLRAGEEVVWEGVMTPGRRRTMRLTVDGRSRRSRQAKSAWLTALGTRSIRRASPGDASGGLVAVHADALDDSAADWPALPPPTPIRRDRKPPVCDGRGPATRAGGISSDVRPIALAHRGVCEAAGAGKAPTGIGRGMPSGPLLGMLRDRIVPVARGCFRRDRAGRADYAVRAVFEFRLADREIVEASVEGEFDEPLRQCLLGAVDRLEIPHFSGTIVVRYPLHTARERAEPRIELSREAAEQVDEMLGPLSPMPIP